MPSLRSLPPLFLLPAWNKSQLLQLAATRRTLSDAASHHEHRVARRKQTSKDSRPERESHFSHPPQNGKEAAASAAVEHGQSEASPRPDPPIRKHAGSDNEKMPKAYHKIRLRYMHAMKTKSLAPKSTVSTDASGSGTGLNHSVKGDPQAQPGWVGIDPKTLMTDEELEALAERAQAQPSSSLFEELFPNEARLQRERSTAAARQTEESLPLPVNAPTPRFATEAPDALSPPDQNRSVQHMRWKQDKVALLYVGGISTDMTAADFHRLIPRGSHIPAWRAPGDFLSIIPGRVSGRDPANLSARRWFVLVFSNPASALAYRDNVLAMHAVAQAHTPTSLLSTPLPPRGFVVDGVHVRRVLADYSLFPPSVAKPDLQVLLTRDNWTFRSLLERRGYAVLKTQSRRPKGGRSVRLWVAGYKPSEAQVESMLARNGRDRGLQWTPFDGSGKGDVVRLYTSDEDEAGQGVDRNTPGLFRWLLTFADEAEARRFVRTWHLRPFRLPPEQRDAGEPAPKVHAEFVW